MSDELIQLDGRKTLVRIAMILAVLTGLLWSWFVVRWYIGDTLAEYVNPDEPNMENVRLAVSLAPNDPLARWRLGEVIKKKLPTEQMEQALREYETAVSLSPNDYRFWMSLGTALEQYGDAQGAESALRRSVQLAPSYSYPAWFLGNLLLRRGRYEEAFAELRRAGESNPDLQPQLFNLALEVYNSDLDLLKTAIGPRPEVRARLALYLLERKRFDDSLRLWNSLSEYEKQHNRETGKSMIANLINAKRFHDALTIWNDISASLTHRAEVGKMLDGRFEADLARAPEPFDWQIKPTSQLQIGIDPNQGNNGNRSLRLAFDVRSRLQGINAEQLVAVGPGTEYVLECYVKTESLESEATPVIQVVDAVEGSVVATSEAAPSGTNNWHRVSLTFKAGAKSEAIFVRIVRSSCGDGSVCPIFGTVWYDDFNLTRRG